MDLSSHEDEEVQIPIPITSTYIGTHNSNGPSSVPPNNSRALTTILTAHYRECLKNHAASIGGHALDGCGEFMPGGEEGTPEAFKCSACHCHRNFHRKEVEGEHLLPPPSSQYADIYSPQLNSTTRKVVGQKGVLISTTRPSPAQYHMIMPVGAIQTSESDEMEVAFHRAPAAKKRFRTKFTLEQKERMLEFAERVGWRLQRREEGEVQQFCQEIGVKRRVLKVWMHNNKHSLARKAIATTPPPPPAPPPLPPHMD